MKSRCRCWSVFPPFASSLAGLSVLSVLALLAAGSAPADQPPVETLLAEPPQSDQPPVFLGTWGAHCNTGVEGVDGCDGDFRYPRGVAVDAAGRVFVADRGNDRIQRFDSDGTYQIKWGVTGAGDGQFDWPEDLAVDSAGRVYVAESANFRIQKFDGDGKFLLKWGSYGTGNYEFRYPVAVALNAADNVYVSDAVGSRVVKFLNIGVYVLEWGGFCDTSVSGVDGCDGEFNVPQGLAIDSSYNVYVADSLNHRIQKFDSTGASLLAKWGEFCDTSVSGVDGCDGKFNNPLGVAVDADDNVYVTEIHNHRVQKFDSSGSFLAKWGAYGDDPGEFDSPSGLAVAASGNVFIADRQGQRVRKYGPALGFFIGSPEPIVPLPGRR